MNRRAALSTVCAGLVLASCSGGPTEGTLQWRLVASSPHSSSVVVQVFHGDCDSIDGGRAVPYPHSVTITVRAAHRTGDCSGVMRVDLVRVRLGASLGDRTVRGQCDPKLTPTYCDPEPVRHVPAHLQVVGP